MKQLLNAIAVLILGAILLGCEQQGPAERAGEQIDDAMEELRDAGEDLQEDLEK